VTGASLKTVRSRLIIITSLRSLGDVLASMYMSRGGQAQSYSIRVFY
jgi:hypothetical protein